MNQLLEANNIITDSRPNKGFLLYGVILLVLVNVHRIQEVLTFLSPLHLGKTTVLLTLMLLLIAPKQSEMIRLTKVPHVKIILAIYILCILSVPTSVWQRESFDLVFKGLTSQIIMLCLLVYSVNDYDDLLKVVWASIFGIFLLCLAAIATGSGTRVSASSTYDPNDIAMMYLIFMPIIYFLMNRRRGLKRLFLFGVLVILLAGLISTGSRGGFLGLLAVTCFIMLKDNTHSWKLKIAAATIAVVAFLHFSPDIYMERIRSITDSNDYNLTSEAGRIAIWSHGIRLMLEHPVLGVGAGAFSTAMGHAYHNSAGFAWTAAHNSFIQIGTEIGVLGLVLFVFLIFSCFIGLHRLSTDLRKKDDTDPDQYAWMVKGLEGSLIAYIVTGAFLSMAYAPALYLILGMSCIVHKFRICESQNSAVQN